MGQKLSSKLSKIANKYRKIRNIKVKVFTFFFLDDQYFQSNFLQVLRGKMRATFAVLLAFGFLLVAFFAVDASSSGKLSFWP